MFIKNRVGGSSALKLIISPGQVELIIMIKNVEKDYKEIWVV